MAFINRALTALKRIFIVIGIALAFSFGLIGAIVLSLRSSETKVPDIVGKDRLAAENTISSAGLNFRVRATRPTSEAKPDTVLIQLPHAGEIVSEADLPIVHTRKQDMWWFYSSVFLVPALVLGAGFLATRGGRKSRRPPASATGASSEAASATPNTGRAA